MLYHLERKRYYNKIFIITQGTLHINIITILNQLEKWIIQPNSPNMGKWNTKITLSAGKMNQDNNFSKSIITNSITRSENLKAQNLLRFEVHDAMKSTKRTRCTGDLMLLPPDVLPFVEGTVFDPFPARISKSKCLNQFCYVSLNN